MADKTYQESTAADHGAPDNPAYLMIPPDGTMLILTVLTFSLLLVVLKKIAWKPILDSLEQRETKIRDSVEKAEEIEKEYEQVDQTTKEMLEKADVDAQELLKKSKTAAQEQSKLIEAKAKDQAKIILENADRDAQETHDKAFSNLKEESADLVIDLAQKLLRSNIDETKNRQIVEEALKDI